jgi:hypothetical protein
MKKVVIFGNCQAQTIYFALTAAPGFTADFQIVYHSVGLKDEALVASLPDYEDCDFLVLQHLNDWDTHPMHDRIPAKTRIIRFPFVMFGALWPCDAFQRGFDPDWSFGPPPRHYSYEDFYLGQLRTLVPDPEERLRVYTDFTFPDAPDIRRYAAFEEARLLKADRETGSSLGRYVVDHYRTARLFHTVSHPSGQLMQQLTGTVLTEMGLDPALVRDVDMDNERYYQVPIHPKVIEALGLTWVDADSTYNFHNERRLTFEAYTRGYIEIYG